MSLALARKWRPKTFSELVGQDHVVTALVNAIVKGRLHHAWLFTGTRGVGKTTIARIISKALNCPNTKDGNPCGECDVCESIDRGRYVDVIELDAASNTQVDNMRDLLETATYAPTVGEYKIFIIDEVHMLSRSAFNAMLKTLEEPPAHVKFILATTDPQKVPVTVLSRCLQFNLRPIPAPIIDEQVKKILKAEAIKFDNQSTQLISQFAKGSLRDSLSLLDQAIAQGNGQLQPDSIKAMLGVVDETKILNLVDIILDRDGGALLSEVDEFEKLGSSFSQVLDEMASLFQRMSIFKITNQDIDEMSSKRIEQISKRVDEEHLQLLYQIATVGKRDLPIAPNERVGFMMMMLRMIAFLPEDSGPVKKTKSNAKKTVNRKVKTADIEKIASVKSDEIRDVRRLSNNSEWKLFVTEKVSTGMAKMLAENTEFVSFKDGLLSLTVEQSNSHLVEDRYRLKLQEVVRASTDERCRVEILVGGQGDTPRADADVQVAKQLKETTKDLEQDPFIKSLKEDLGGTVVEDSIRPTKVSDKVSKR